MKKSELSPCPALYPVPVALVSSIDKATGKINIITIAWCGNICSDPPMVSISIRPSRLSHSIISQTKDFVINIPTSDMARKVDLCGVKSGRDTDKFKACSLTPAASLKISSPAIKECPVNIECALKSVIKLGTHDMFIGEVLTVRADESIMGENGAIDYAKARPFTYNQGEYWDLGKNIGSHGFSSR
jgi:flavin reductase (DIM6/NTAB) family NADH-FMN oxidoreductase RutF